MCYPHVLSAPGMQLRMRENGQDSWIPVVRGLDVRGEPGEWPGRYAQSSGPRMQSRVMGALGTCDGLNCAPHLI